MRTLLQQDTQYDNIIAVDDRYIVKCYKALSKVVSYVNNAVLQ